MLSSPPCRGCTTHTGCEAIPGPSGTTFNDLDTATHLQSQPGIASIQNHGAGNDTSRGTLPVLCLAPPGAGQPGGSGGDTWLRVAGHTSSMEAMTVATPSLSPHAVAAIRVVPNNAADAEARPSKKRRTKAPRSQFSPSQVRTEASIWHNEPSYGRETYGAGTGSAHGVVGLAGPSLPLYSPDSQYPIRHMGPASFVQIPHSSQGSWMPNEPPQLDAAPHPPLGADASAPPGRMLWGDFPPSPVDQVTAGPLSFHWPPTAPAIPPPVDGLGSLGSYDQSQASIVQNIFPSLPTPPIFTGTDAHQFTAFPFENSDGGCSPLAAEQLAGRPGAPSDQGAYLQLLQRPVEAILLQNTAESKFDQVGGYGAPPAVFTSYQAPATLNLTPNGNPPSQLNIGDLELSELYGQAIEQLEDGDWIKEEPLTSADGDWGIPIPAGAMMSVSHADVVEESPKPVNGLDDEGARDRKKRGPLNEGLRAETSNTRQIGACMRCHNQRIRCKPNDLDPTNPLAPCKSCLSVRKNSKKTIHYIPCLRFKVTSMVVYRAGGLGYTERFDHTKVVDVVDYSDGAIYNIEITQGLCQSPMLLQVRRFRPRRTDKTHWSYQVARVHKTQDTGAFCLADIEETARKFNEYIHYNAVKGLAEAVKNSDEMVKEVFAMIESHCTSLPVAIKSEVGQGAKGGKKQPDQREFLRKMVRFWFAIRHGTGSAWLCGNERLGLSPISEPSHPYYGRVLVSRMIVAQFDSIRHEYIYKKLAPDVLRTIDTFLASCNKEAWFTVFLATFLLLHLAACTSQDRYRHAKQNSGGESLDTRYGNHGDPLIGFVEEVHHGAVMLLAHWQYFKRCDLMNFDWNDIEESALTFLEPAQIECIKSVVGRLKEVLPSIPTTPEAGCWEHELFWISKMFVSNPSPKTDWTPPEMFTRAKPNVGRE